MSKQMGLSPTEYYNKRILELKGTLGPVPMPKATRQNIIGFCRRMEPPSRQQTIPWCTTGKVTQSTSTFINILQFCMQFKVKYIHLNIITNLFPFIFRFQNVLAILLTAFLGNDPQTRRRRAPKNHPKL